MAAASDRAWVATSGFASKGTRRLQPIKFFDDFLHAADYEREPIVIKFVGRITGRVIVRISKRRGISDHDGRITILPERPLVRPTDAGNKPGKRCSFRW